MYNLIISFWSQLINRFISNKYMVTVRNKFNTLLEITESLTPNDEYENFVNAYMETTAKYILTQLRAKHRVCIESISS